MNGILIARDLNAEIKRLKQYFPVIVVTGPRQSGKTTLCRNLYSGYRAIDMMRAADRQMVEANPEAFLKKYADGLLIDEAQYYPEIFDYLRITADELPQSNFIVTGSNNLSLMEKVTESLAGRAAMLVLLPLSLHELGEKAQTPTLTLLLKGSYPAVWTKDIPAGDAMRQYYNLYVERDVRRLINVKDMSKFQVFMKLCAGRTGSEFNANNLSVEVGVSVPTIQEWLSVLEASYVVFRLHPFYRNVGKRLIKTPKIYFYDTALACFLLGIENENHLETHPLRGMLFENYVVLELLKNRYNAGKDNNLLFYRDKSQHEIDIVQDFGATCRAFEIKSATAFRSDFLNNLKYLKSLLGEALVSTQVIYDGNSNTDIQENGIVNFRNIAY
jgi:predicted AAA+ superfamily ATPase